MKIKYLLLVFLILIGIFFYYKNIIKEGCNCDNIFVTGNLELASKRIGIDYCDLLKCSLSNDECLIKLFKINNITNSAGYDHGYVLLEITQKKGESYIINIIKTNFNDSEKSNLLQYIEAGIENSDVKVNQPLELIKVLTSEH